MKRVIDFIIQKRSKDDVVLFFDGRSKACRHVMEAAEERLAASGAHSPIECWFVDGLPNKTQDPRIPARQTSHMHNNKEICHISSPCKKTEQTNIPRSEYNSCGEVSTAWSTYTSVPNRRYGELPRMDAETKQKLVGTAQPLAALKGKRVCRDV